MDDGCEELRALLRDPGRAQYSWMTLPETMAVEETADAAAALAQRGITVSSGDRQSDHDPGPSGRAPGATPAALSEPASFEALRADAARRSPLTRSRRAITGAAWASAR